MEQNMVVNQQSHGFFMKKKKQEEKKLEFGDKVLNHMNHQQNINAAHLHRYLILRVN